jgi:hypothetical protein
MKKIIASIAAAALTVAALAVPANAIGTDIVDFEDGDMSFVAMYTDDGGDASVLSVVDFNGSKMLKVEVQDYTLVPKVKFNVDAMLDPASRPLVNSITYDVIIENRDGATPVSWAGGSMGSQGDPEPAWSASDWSLQDDVNAVTAVTPMEKKFLLPTSKFTETATDDHLMFMVWARTQDYNVYLDNIKFLDKDGNAIALSTGAAATTDTAADTTTTAPATGNAPIAIAATVATLAGVSMVVSRKRK